MEAILSIERMVNLDIGHGVTHDDLTSRLYPADGFGTFINE
jgi:hypothetical protein